MGEIGEDKIGAVMLQKIKKPEEHHFSGAGLLIYLFTK